MTSPDDPPRPPRAAVPGGPRRVSPRTLVVGPLREFAGFLAIAAGGLALGGAALGLLIAVTATVLGAVLHVVNWWTFTYRLYDDRIELRRALIGRSVKTIPVERVRGVDITASFLHRLFGLAVVRIDAAVGGDGGEEGRLDAVRVDEAERVRSLLLARRPGLPSAASGTSAADETGRDGAEREAEPADPRGSSAPVTARPPRGAVRPGDEVYARARRRWYVYGPLSGAFLLTPFAVAGSVAGFVYNLGDELGLVTEQRLTSAAGWLAHSPGLLIAGLAVLVVLSPVVAVLAFTLVNWDFTLRRRGGSIVTERGMLTRRSVSLEHRRIRGVELRDNPFERAAGVARLNALVTGLGDAATRGQLLPTSPRGEAAAAATGILGHGDPARAGGTEPAAPWAPLTAHPPAARRRRLIRAVVPWLLIAALAVPAHRPPTVYALLGLALAGVPLGLDRYRQLGHATGGGRLVVRSGSLSRRRVEVDAGAVVGWQIRQSLPQRRLALATLVVGVGAGEGGYRAIDMAEADVATFVQRVTPAWVEPFVVDTRAADGRADARAPDHAEESGAAGDDTGGRDPGDGTGAASAGRAEAGRDEADDVVDGADGADGAEPGR